MDNQPFHPQPDAAPCRNRQTRARAAVSLLVLLVGITLSVCYAYYTIFSMFGLGPPVDDEGFILISHKFFFHGGALYDDVFSCYQPFFHVFNWLVFVPTGIPLCHDNIRILTIVLWLAGAMLNTTIAYKLTSSRLLALLVLILSVHHLRAFSGAPGHPESLAYVLVAATVALFVFMDRLPRAVFALALGGILGLLLLTKINVGVYVLLPSVMVLAAGTGGVFPVRLQAALGAAMIALPVALMHSRLTQLAMSIPSVLILGLLVCCVVAAFMTRSEQAVPRVLGLAGCAAVTLVWFQPYGFPLFYFTALVTLSIAGVVLSVRANRPGLGMERRTWMLATLCGVATMAAVILVVVLRGTSMHGLLNGLFLGALTQSSIYFAPCHANAGGVLLALGGLAGCCGFLWAQKSFTDCRSFHLTLALTKILFGVVVLAYFSPLRSAIPLQEKLPAFWALPLVWLVAVPAAANPAHHMARLALMTTAVMQSLVAYPVPHSQLVFATALLPVIGTVCLADALQALMPRMSDIISLRWLPNAAGGIVAFSILYGFAILTLQARWDYLSYTPLDLPGASRIRLPCDEVSLYHELVNSLARPEVETFLTLPGFNSLYFWARKEPPTGLNFTAWMFSLDEHSQQRIWDAASQHRGVMAVRNRRLAEIWTQGRPFDHLPLVRAINENFQTVKVIGRYELMMRR